MNILIIDGNEESASQTYRKLNMDTQYEVYKKVINKLSKFKINISTIHPACNDDFIPLGLNLDDFDGIAWTGSLLNIYDGTPSIKRQIELAKILLNKKNKIFGSCWGLQVLTVAAGGSVRKNPKGLEAIIAKNISLNEKGVNHPMYKNKPKKFDSFCWHYDEIETLPSNTNVLSSNNISNFQSVTFQKKNSEVWAVQYHPEFNPIWMSELMKQRKEVLLENKIYETLEEFEKFNLYFSNTKKYDYLKKTLSISNSLIDNKIHTTELYNWLQNI